MLKSLTIAAVDAGTGYTKHSLLCYGRRADIHSFPSITDLVLVDSRDNGMGSVRQNALVPVGDSLYEVGPDIDLAVPRPWFHSATQGFAGTHDYRALVAGALSIMDEPLIDMLVLSAPMKECKPQERQLDRWLCQPVRTATRSDVTVVRLEVLPQATACAIEWLATPAMRDDHVSLVLVAGYGSIDWGLYRGAEIDAIAGGTLYAGIRHILSEVARQLSRRVGRDYTNAEAIDLALRAGKHLRAFGRDYELGAYWAAIHAQARDMVRCIALALKELPSPHTVWLAGGGATYFRHAVESCFRDRPVLVPDEPFHASVRGMRIYGKRRLMCILDALCA